MQVRSFAKEGGVRDRYEAAQKDTLKYGLRSAVLDGAFSSVNSSMATGVGWVVMFEGTVAGCFATRSWVRVCVCARVCMCVRSVNGCVWYVCVQGGSGRRKGPHAVLCWTVRSQRSIRQWQQVRGGPVALCWRGGRRLCRWGVYVYAGLSSRFVGHAGNNEIG